MPKGDMLLRQLIVPVKVRSIQLSSTTIDALKKINNNPVKIIVNPRTKALTERSLIKELKVGDYIYLRNRNKKVLVRIVANIDAIRQGLGSNVLYFKDGTSIDCFHVEFRVIRIPNISKGAYGIEYALHPSFKTFEGETIESLIDKHGSYESVFYKLLDNGYFEYINESGGIELLTRLHFEGVHSHPYLDALRNCFKRYRYLKSVSRFEK